MSIFYTAVRHWNPGQIGTLIACQSLRESSCKACRPLGRRIASQANHHGRRRADGSRRRRWHRRSAQLRSADSGPGCDWPCRYRIPGGYGGFRSRHGRGRSTLRAASPATRHSRIAAMSCLLLLQARSEPCSHYKASFMPPRYLRRAWRLQSTSLNRARGLRSRARRWWRQRKWGHEARQHPRPVSGQTHSDLYCRGRALLFRQCGDASACR